MSEPPFRPTDAMRSRWVDGGLDRVPLSGDRPGGLWLCGKRVVGPDPDAALERADHAGLIVCLNERPELRDYPAYPDWLEANADQRALWHPVPDLHAPTIEVARSIVATIVERLDRDEGVIVHCAGGMGRAPTIAICVLMELGETLTRARDHVRSHRPGGGPEAGAQHRLVEAYARVP